MPLFNVVKAIDEINVPTHQLTHHIRGLPGVCIHMKCKARCCFISFCFSHLANKCISLMSEVRSDFFCRRETGVSGFLENSSSHRKWEGEKKLHFLENLVLFWKMNFSSPKRITVPSEKAVLCFKWSFMDHKIGCSQLCCGNAALPDAFIDKLQP